MGFLHPFLRQPFDSILGLLHGSEDLNQGFPRPEPQQFSRSISIHAAFDRIGPAERARQFLGDPLAILPLDGFLVEFDRNPVLGLAGSQRLERLRHRVVLDFSGYFLTDSLGFLLPPVLTFSPGFLHDLPVHEILGVCPFRRRPLDVGFELLGSGLHILGGRKQGPVSNVMLGLLDLSIRGIHPVEDFPHLGRQPHA